MASAMNRIQLLSGLTSTGGESFLRALPKNVEPQRVANPGLSVAASLKKSSDSPPHQRRAAVTRRDEKPGQSRRKSRPVPAKQTVPSTLAAIEVENAQQLRLFGVEVPYEGDPGKDSVDVTNVLIERAASILNVLVRTTHPLLSA